MKPAVAVRTDEDLDGRWSLVRLVGWPVRSVGGPERCLLKTLYITPCQWGRSATASFTNGLTRIPSCGGHKHSANWPTASHERLNSAVEEFENIHLQGSARDGQKSDPDVLCPHVWGIIHSGFIYNYYYTRTRFRDRTDTTLRLFSAPLLASFLFRSVSTDL